MTILSKSNHRVRLNVNVNIADSGPLHMSPVDQAGPVSEISPYL